MLRLAGFLALAVAGTAAAQSIRVDKVRFVENGPKLVFAEEPVTAYGDDGERLFRGSRAFILGYAKSDGTVREWHVSRNRVRIGESEKGGVWLSCDQLEAMPVACASAASFTGGGVVTIGGAPGRAAVATPRVSPTKGFALPKKAATAPRRVRTGAARGTSDALPLCPGDPRCPSM